MAYAAALISTAIHEVLGHAVAIALSGGSVDHIAIRADGAGVTVSDGGFADSTFVCAAGVVAEWVFGIALFVVAARSRRVFLRLAAIVLAVSLIGEAGPYAFWGSVMADGRDDFGRIVRLHGGAGSAVHWTLTVATGVVWVASDVLVLRAAFRWSEDVLGPLSRGRALALLVGFLVVDAATWSLFDWDGMASGMGRSIVAAGISLDVCIFATLCHVRRSDVVRSDVSVHAWRRAIVVSWLGSAASSAAILVGFR
jgi:hypothetical protein